MPGPNTRPVHPCLMSVFDGTRGAEYSTWAFISYESSCPNLVTAQGSTMRIYTLDEENGKLCEYFDTTLAGNVCFLETLPAADNKQSGEKNTKQRSPDSLLIGFCGHPRLTIVSVETQDHLAPTPKVLAATSLVDLTQALIDNSFGSVTPLEHDLVATSVFKKNGDRATLAVILGNGILVSCIDLARSKKGGKNGWIASEPFLLPLASLQASVQRSQTAKSQSALGMSSSSISVAASNLPSIATGFGDIVSVTFLPGYSEPTVLLLHSNPAAHGRVWPGRLGRPHWQQGTRFGMLVTAISVTVSHQRSAVLWSVEVPADAISLHRVGLTGCLVLCANSLLTIDNAGRIHDFLSVNGYVRSTCPTRLLELLKPNPKPFPKLAIQLDGAALAFCSDSLVILSLRSGGLYLLQLNVTSSNRSGGRSVQDTPMCLLPLGKSLGSCGNVANLIACPLESSSSVLYHKMQAKDEKTKSINLSMGLLFAGSMVGDSVLLGYCLELVDFPWMDDQNPGKRIKLQDDPDVEFNKFVVDLLPSKVSLEIDNLMSREEDALYTSTGYDANALTEEAASATGLGGKRKTLRRRQIAVLRGLTPLDSITGLGPLGPSCEGPFVPPLQQDAETAAINPDAAVVAGTPALIVPCGFGSSGALGIVTTPGRDERAILSEVDCLGTECIFSLRSCRLVLMGTIDAGIRVLRLLATSRAENPDSVDLIELDHADCLAHFEDGTVDRTRRVFQNGRLLSCAELAMGRFALAVSLPNDSQQQYAVAIAKETSGLLDVTDTFFLPSQEGRGKLVSMSPMESIGSSESDIVFACVWANGSCTVVVLNANGFVKVCDFAGIDEENEPMESIDSELADEVFYNSRRIVAVDFVCAPLDYFGQPRESAHDVGENENSSKSAEKNQENEDDYDLYVSPEKSRRTVDGTGRNTDDVSNASNTGALFFGICRQSGDLEVFRISDIVPDQEPTPVWVVKGCGHGISSLSGSPVQCRIPRQHQVWVREIRFFYCGPTELGIAKDIPGLSRPLCLAVHLDTGDLHLYAADARTGLEASGLRFARISLKTVSRQSQEQARFAAKLRRKGIVSSNATQEGESTFNHNKLHRFQSLSQQDGCFAAVARPIWLVAERGRPTAISHRLRHAAPAGGRALPVSGFCSNLDCVGAFLTVHDRVGRFGSQRVTLYQEISKVFQGEGLLPGGGLCLEKIPLGVTIRHVQFLDDSQSQGRCLYAMLVSRELDVDMSRLNDDGMTQDEREKLEQDKEAAKIKRQVEADLGGFDVEQEWVEEIEREDCFQVDKELGGAPPNLQSAYALWIVDAANKWMVVDSHELGEFDQGMTMRVMTLTDFPEEPGSSNANAVASEDLDSKLFIAVGVGIVDKNGEDVSSKGKVLLFDVTAQKRKEGTKSVELSLVWEKVIFHGPVTSLSCLSSEGKNRLVIGAGADINVEQWGNDKLTQVGFYRATMQVLDIFIFKNFFLLSDAYDSLYFLVWRESDKSLTLLSKDYDPLVVYAAGTISRGGSLTFVSHDERQNLQFFQYAPGEAAARGGNKLVCRADFHLGSQTAAFQNHSCKSSLYINSASPTSTLAALKQQDAFFGRADDDQRIAAHFGTSDGGFGSVVPLSEPVYWRLAALQSVMANALENDCALSNRAWRLYTRSFKRGGCRGTDRKKGVIDGDLVAKYMDLPLSDQEDLASAIGSTVGLILDNLLELNCATSVV